MLRWLLVLLIVANVGTWAFQQGHLRSLGWAPVSVRETERLATQVAAEKLQWRLAGSDAVPGPASTAATPANLVSGAETPGPSEPTTCWQASGYTVTQADTLRVVLSDPAIPSGWELEENLLPARWIVYVGKLASTDALTRRKSDLRAAKVEFRDVSNPSLAPGLALGTFSSEEAAAQAQQDIQKAGVRGTKVVQERLENRSYTLRWPALTASERERLNPLGPSLSGKSLQPCS